jgi:hypothetical protein
MTSSVAYPPGYSEAEARRLAHQATLLEDLTENLFLRAERDVPHAFSRLSARTIGSPLERAGHPEADPALPARVVRGDHVAISRTADRRIV